MADPDLPRRLKAARALAGLSREALAGKINQRGLKVGVLRKYEEERGYPETRDLEAIATACGVPAAWFYVDFSRLGELQPSDPREDLRRASERARLRFEQRTEGNRAGSQSRRQGGRKP